MAASSVLEPMVNLYRLTGEQRYLDFCRYIVAPGTSPTGRSCWPRCGPTGSVFKTANAKAYEMMSDLVGVVELYKVTGDESLLPPVLTAWHDIRDKRLYVTGTTSSKEHFLDDDVLPGDDKDNVGEGCATVTWLQLTWRLLRLTGAPEYAEELERTVYNQLLGRAGSAQRQHLLLHAAQRDEEADARDQLLRFERAAGHLADPGVDVGRVRQRARRCCSIPKVRLRRRSRPSSRRPRSRTTARCS